MRLFNTNLGNDAVERFKKGEDVFFFANHFDKVKRKSYEIKVHLYKHDDTSFAIKLSIIADFIFPGVPKFIGNVEHFVSFDRFDVFDKEKEYIKLQDELVEVMIPLFDKLKISHNW